MRTQHTNPQPPKISGGGRATLDPNSQAAYSINAFAILLLYFVYAPGQPCVLSAIFVTVLCLRTWTTMRVVCSSSDMP
eukprot:124097-Prorocentrum_minimum.AAC.1